MNYKRIAALLLAGSMLLSAGGCLNLEEESSGGGRNESIPQTTVDRNVPTVTPTRETGTRLFAGQDGPMLAPG